MARSMEEIAELLKRTKFKRSLFGVDEADVWSKLTRLQAEYTAVIAQEHEHCQALLDEREKYISRQNEYIHKLQAQLKSGRTDDSPAAREGSSDG